MAQDWENIFSTWAKPPSKTEQEKCENTERAIRNAIAASDKLKHRNIRVSTQGSYRNNTNVRQDSDVDIAILCFNTFFYSLPEGYTSKDFNIDPASYGYSQFKDEVGEALASYFGQDVVRRGNKAFDVHENTYRVDADVAPFFEHRRYDTDASYLSGVELSPDNGGRVINWPEQHYENNVSKNTVTRRRFKSVVRIQKALSNEMAEANISAAKSVSGFLIECLVWNVPNDYFSHDTYKADVRECLAYLFNNTMADNECSEWGEVSELKYLFGPHQKWTRQQAHEFLSEAWDYIGFE